MKTIIILFCALLFIPLCANAQKVNLKGRIVDNTQTSIDGACVSLVDKDSNIVSSIVSNSDGQFSFSYSSEGNYSLNVSHIGYMPLAIKLIALTGNNDVGEIILEPRVEKLEEVRVIAKAESVRAEDDRLVYVPSKDLKDKSYNSFELLKKLSLPEIKYDIFSESLNSLKNGSVQVRLNGVLIPQEDLKTINPKEIRIINYIDQPGIRWGDNVAVVIDIMTHRIEKGVQVGVSTNNEVTNPHGYNSAYARIFRGKNMFYVSAGMNYETSINRYSNSLKNYTTPEQEIRLNKEGIPVNNQNLGANAKLEFNRKFNDKITLNTRFNYSYDQSPNNNTTFGVTQDNIPLYVENTLSNSYSHNTALDVYLDYDISAKDKLIVDLTATNITSDYNRTYAIDNLTSSAYTVDGCKYSLISEVIYERNLFNNHTLATGLRSNISNTDNIYLESNNNSVNTLLSNRDLYMYLSFAGSIKRFSYSIGAGYSYEYMGQNKISSEYHFFRPRVNLSYDLGKKWSLRYALMINPISPKLNELTNFRQIVNEFEAYDGNPNLKPYQAYMNQLSVGYFNERTTFVVTGYYQYNKNPIFSNPVIYLQKENFFIQTIANQKAFNHIQAKIYASHKLFNNSLSLSGYAVYNRYINQGNIYTTTLNDFIYGISVAYDKNQWGVSTNFYSPIDMLFGQSLIKNPMSLDINAYYKFKGFLVGVGVNNPFMKTKYEVIQNSELLTSATASYSKNNNNRIYVKVSWNLNTGKTKTFYRRTDNTDESSGIVK